MCLKKYPAIFIGFLDGEMEAVNRYQGEYMNAYGWASMTEAYLTRKGLR